MLARTLAALDEPLEPAAEVTGLPALDQLLRALAWQARLPEFRARPKAPAELDWVFDDEVGARLRAVVAAAEAAWPQEATRAFANAAWLALRGRGPRTLAQATPLLVLAWACGDDGPAAGAAALALGASREVEDLDWPAILVVDAYTSAAPPELAGARRALPALLGLAPLAIPDAAPGLATALARAAIVSDDQRPNFAAQAALRALVKAKPYALAEPATLAALVPPRMAATTLDAALFLLVRVARALETQGELRRLAEAQVADAIGGYVRACVKNTAVSNQRLGLIEEVVALSLAPAALDMDVELAAAAPEAAVDGPEAKRPRLLAAA